MVGDVTGMSLSTDTRWHGRDAVVAVNGALDYHSASDLGLELGELLGVASSHAMVLLDLRGLDFCDSSGLAVFVDAHKRAESVGGYFALVGVSDKLYKRLVITGLIGMLSIYDTVSAALAQSR